MFRTNSVLIEYFLVADIYPRKNLFFVSPWLSQELTPHKNFPLDQRIHTLLPPKFFFKARFLERVERRNLSQAYINLKIQHYLGAKYIDGDPDTYSPPKKITA